MILAENFNLQESLLFSISARETLCLLVNESKISHKTELKSFLINEATNYQIMSLIIDGILPLDEINYFDELVLFERMRIEVKENKDFIYELFGVDLFDDITKKVDSINPEFFNVKPLLEDNMDPKIRSMLDSAKKAAAKVDLDYDNKNIVDKFAPKPDTVKKGISLHARIIKSFDNLKQQASSGSNAVTSFVKAHPVGISGVLLAVLAIYVSAKIYKRFYSKAAKSCSSYKGQKKTICMKKFQLGGYKIQIEDLKKAADKCGMTKNPKKCITAIQIKIDKINKKISKAV